MEKYLERASYDWSEDSVRLIYTASQTTKNTLFFVQETGYFKTTSPYFTERRNLDSFLVLYTISGSGILKIFGEEYTVTKNTLFFIPCISHHYYSCNEDSSWEFLWLHFNGVCARGYYDKFYENCGNLIELNRHSKIPNQLNEIIRIIKGKPVNCDYIVSNIITSILTQLIILNGQSSQTAILPEYLTKTIRYIDQHYKEEISLDNLSREIGISKYYLLKQFKKYYGTTITEYQIMNRLNYTKELLRYTDKSISEISFECGINHTSHFIKLFKKHEGVTPLQYRNRWS